MNYMTAQKTIYGSTERDAEKLIKRMLGIYENAGNEITEKLEKIYGKYLTMVDPEDYYNILIQYGRLNNLQLQVQKTYSFYAGMVERAIPEISTYAMTSTYYKQHYVLEWFTPAEIGLNFSYLDPRLVELSVYGTQDAWKAIKKEIPPGFQPQYGSLKDILNKNRVNDIMKVQQTIVQNIITGGHIEDMTKSIGDIMDNAAWQSERIARTEFTRCANLGDYAATLDAKDQGVGVVRQWISTIDSKTRRDHQILDGQLEDDEGYFHVGRYKAITPGGFGVPSEDIHCRCTVITLIEGMEPQLRRGKNPLTGKDEIFNFRNYDLYMESKGMKLGDGEIWIQK